MKVEEVAKLSPIDRFMYWIQERHRIYIRRMSGWKKPWTDDKVLQQYFFTNPYRENDKVTVWFREMIREPLRNDPAVLFATICFRWFNTIPTGWLLLDTLTNIPPHGYLVDEKIRYSVLCNWNRKEAIRRLQMQQLKGEPVFTAAFMIPAPPGSKKIEHVCGCLDTIWDDRHNLLRDLRDDDIPSLRRAHERIMQYPWLGKFMAYEVVTDLRHTYLLDTALDIETWANPGPGCIRGLYRLSGLHLSGKGNSDCLRRPDDWQTQMQNLLVTVRTCHPNMPHFEMREIEHSLCEWDKYERGRLEDGRMKRRYNGV
jgi:hypothetical protein